MPKKVISWGRASVLLATTAAAATYFLAIDNFRGHAFECKNMAYDVRSMVVRFVSNEANTHFPTCQQPEGAVALIDCEGNQTLASRKTYIDNIAHCGSNARYPWLYIAGGIPVRDAIANSVPVFICNQDQEAGGYVIFANARIEFVPGDGMTLVLLRLQAQIRDRVVTVDSDVAAHIDRIVSRHSR